MTPAATIFRNAIGGALLCAGLGLVALWLGGWPVLLSYDLLFLFRNTPALDDIRILYMDDKSFSDLGQRNTPNWDRNLHAQLLDRLTSDRCKLVVFDVVFSEAGSPEANTNLARAMRHNGKVVLAASLDQHSRPQIKINAPLRPLPEFEDAAAGWGLAEVLPSPGKVARQYYSVSESGPGLAWAAASLAGAEVTKSSSSQATETWLNYYGRALTIPSLGYSQASNQPAGYFRDKYVFVGARPRTLKAQDEVDEFRTPHTLWRGEYFPGVEISATAFLNLLRDDCLARSSWAPEFWLVLLAGLLFGGGLGVVRPLAGAGIAVAGAALLLFAAIEAAGHHLWFPWTVVTFVQLPGALLWALRGHFHRLRFEKAVLERTLVETSRWAAAGKAGTTGKTGLVIPDHSLLRRVGKGAYGEVWLARSTIELFHAVKIVQRREFPSEEPYEREFKGMQKFMPISRSHPGLVHVLHIGRNEGYFFYIMEAGDDETSAQRIDPDHYSPKTLATELSRRGMLSVEECLRLGLALALALEHLHQQQLVHRDIKPGNIIYVNGAPKLADIGLVTDLSRQSPDASRVGTEGYIAPEGPGTAAADVFALGKVLYEASTGRDRRLFPEVATAILELSSETLARQLNDVIGRACATSLDERYQSAGEFHADLLKLQTQL